MENLTPEQENLFLKIKNELDEHLDKRVDEHLEKDRNLIKETIATVSTIFRWTVVIAALLVALLGLKTYLDINKQIKTKIQSVIKSKIDSSNVLSIYDKKASKLYRQSLIESYMIKIPKGKNDNYQSNVRINKLEFDELLQTISEKETDYDDFKNALFILNNVRIPLENFNDLCKTLTNLVLNKDKKTDWLEEQEYKREDLLTTIGTFGIEDCKSFCTDVLKNNSAKSSIISSINYLKKIHAKESLSLIEGFMNNDDDEIQITAIKAIAYINFQNKTISEYLNKLNYKTISPSDAGNLIKVLNEILLGISDNGFLLNMDDNERIKFNFSGTREHKDKFDNASLLISQCLLKLEPRFKLSFNVFSESLIIYEINNIKNRVEIPNELFFAYNYAIPNKMLDTANITEFKKAIDFLTVKYSDLEEDNSNFYTIAADLKNGGGIITELGRVDKRIINNKCWFNLEKNLLKLNFWDKDGNYKTLNVLKLDGIDSIRFSLQKKSAELSKEFF